MGAAGGRTAASLGLPAQQERPADLGCPDKTRFYVLHEPCGIAGQEMRMEVHKDSAGSRRRRRQDLIHASVRSARDGGVYSSKEVARIVSEARIVDVGYEDAGGRKLLQHSLDRLAELAEGAIVPIEQTCD